MKDCVLLLLNQPSLMSHGMIGYNESHGHASSQTTFSFGVFAMDLAQFPEIRIAAVI